MDGEDSGDDGDGDGDEESEAQVTTAVDELGVNRVSDVLSSVFEADDEERDE